MEGLESREVDSFSFPTFSLRFPFPFRPFRAGLDATAARPTLAKSGDGWFYWLINDLLCHLILGEAEKTRKWPCWTPADLQALPGGKVGEAVALGE